MALERNFLTPQEGGFEFVQDGVQSVLERNFLTPISSGFIFTAPPPVELQNLFYVISNLYSSSVLKAKESGFRFVYITNFDISNNEQLSLKLTDPYGAVTFIDSARITAPSEDIQTGDAAYPTIVGDRYMQFFTLDTDIPVAGVWKAQGLYVRGSAQIPGDSVYFVVGGGFYG